MLARALGRSRRPTLPGRDIRRTMSLLPNRLLMRDYRSFCGEHVLELRPLTLVYGTNNAGKSALIRSLPLIADSLSGELDALNLDGRFKKYDLGFDNLRFRGRDASEDPTLGLGLGWPEGDGHPAQAIDWSIQNESTWSRMLVERLRIRRQLTESTALLSAERQLATPKAERRLPDLRYRLSSHQDREERIRFSGLRPDLDGHLETAELEALNQRMGVLSDRVLWLRALRPAPNRYTTWRGAVRWSLAPDGADAPVVLAGEEEVQKEVAGWYQRYARRALLVEQTRPREATTVIQSPAGFPINLVDAGEGLGQVLPVITALAMARRHAERSGSSILVIEEPEAHLHPDLQEGLAEQICDVIHKGRPLVLIETHSYALLLAVQLQLVKQRLRKEDVILYWVEQSANGQSVAHSVEFDDLARYRGNWPPTAFQDDLRLRADLLDAREEQERKVGAET